MHDHHCHQYERLHSRRDFLARTAMGLGATALGALINPSSLLASSPRDDDNQRIRGILDHPHFPPKAKRIIYMFQSGGPSQMELFDYKPLLNERHGEELPESVRGGQRLTGMSGFQNSLPLAGSRFSFAQHGESGAWVSELLPYTAGVVDDLCIIKSMHTEAINHDPAITFFQTGSQIAGRPSMGSWLSYGLGSENENLPAFCVLITKDKGGQPLYARLWGNGFLPSLHQGVQFRSGQDPVLYLNNPEGISEASRRKMLDRLRELHELQLEATADPELETRIAQYEMAYRMQTSVPELTDFSDEPQHILDMYGPDVHTQGSYAYNCLMARRLAERGTRFIQLMHAGWDQHKNLNYQLKTQCVDTDAPSAALVKDLKQRGMLDDTLVIWGGEFGRTPFLQGKIEDKKNWGRDHHPYVFTLWMAGGGVKPGFSYGASDEFGFNVQENGVHVHDFQATILHLLGIDHERLTFKHQGRRYRLTDVHGKVVQAVLG